MKNVPFQYILFGALFASFLVSSLSAYLLRRMATELDINVRKRIWQSEDSRILWWRVPEMLGLGLLMLSFLKVFGPAFPFSTIAAGVILFCLAKAGRAWITNAAYQNEAPGSPAASTSRIAAVLVTVVEAVIGGGAAWLVMSRNWVIAE